MSIKGNFPQDVVDLDAAIIDTTLFDSEHRASIIAMSIHNVSSGDREVWLYISPDTTSVAGRRVAVYDIPAGESFDIDELIGQGLSEEEQIIGHQRTFGSLAADLNCKLTYIRYTGDS